MNPGTPIVFILFGATGDLAQKKIMPALINLYKNKYLPENMKIVAFSRRSWRDADYHAFIRPALEASKSSTEEEIQNFLRHIVYTEGSFDDPSSFHALHGKLNAIDTHAHEETQKIYHLAVQPQYYLNIIKYVTEAGLQKSKDPSLQPKFLIEKPFGTDYDSAVSLEHHLEEYVAEHQLYRVDHYLGKAGLWKIIQERLIDSAFEKKLNFEHVRKIHLRFFEKDGVETRGEFYDAVGTLRDVVQNHMMEMLTYVLMDVPRHGLQASLVAQRAHALSLLQITHCEHPGQCVIRGQYQGYREIADVRSDSTTETYIHIIGESKNPRWEKVPMILEAGKAMHEKKSNVEIVFHDGTKRFFPMDDTAEIMHNNVHAIGPYEVVIEAALRGDKNYFVSIDEVLASWKFVAPILAHMDEVPLKIYKPGAEKI